MYFQYLKKIVNNKLKTSSNRITRSQGKEFSHEISEAEESDDDHVSDSDDEEYFPESEMAASDCDDAGNLLLYFLSHITIIVINYVLCFIYCEYL